MLASVLYSFRERVSKRTSPSRCLRRWWARAVRCSKVLGVMFEFRGPVHQGGLELRHRLFQGGAGRLHVVQVILAAHGLQPHGGLVGGPLAEVADGPLQCMTQ